MIKSIKFSVISLIAISSIALSSCEMIGTYPGGNGYSADYTPLSSPHNAILEGDEARLNVLDEAKWNFAARDMVGEFTNSSTIRGVDIGLEQGKEISDHASMVFDNFLRDALIDSGYSFAKNNESDYKIVYSARLMDEDVKNEDTHIQLTLSLFIDEEQINQIVGVYQIDVEEENNKYFSNSSFLPSDKRIKERYNIDEK